MVVDIIANILKDSHLAPNHPAQDWPIWLRISNGEGRRILESQGKIRAAELQAVVLMGAASDAGAIPQFIKGLMDRKVAEIRNLEIPNAGIQLLLDVASHS